MLKIPFSLLHAARACALAACILCTSISARAERPDAPIAWLHTAPYQLEVTVLSVETKKGPHSGDTIWHRVRIERVMHVPESSKLKVGDEIAVVSVTYKLAPGSVGSTGDRGLPLKGERKRIFASGNSNGSILQSMPPTGWQPLLPGVACFDAAGDREPATIALAAMLAGHALARPEIDPLLCTWRADAAIIDLSECATALSTTQWIDDDEQRKLKDFAQSQLPMLVLPLKGDIDLGLQKGDEKAPSTRDPSLLRSLLGAALVQLEHAPSLALRVQDENQPAEKPHVLASFITPPKEITTLACNVKPAAALSEDCSVLLWGEVMSDVQPETGITLGQKIPLLWTRELPRERKPGFGEQGEPEALPPQRIVVSLLSPTDLESAGQGELLRHLSAWMLGTSTQPLENPEPAKPKN